MLTAKQCKILVLLFSEVLSQISLTFKNCCIPGLYSNISNNTSALLGRLAVYAYRTVPSGYRALQTWVLIHTRSFSSLTHDEINSDRIPPLTKSKSIKQRSESCIYDVFESVMQITGHC